VDASQWRKCECSYINWLNKHQYVRDATTSAAVSATWPRMEIRNLIGSGCGSGRSVNLCVPCVCVFLGKPISICIRICVFSALWQCTVCGYGPCSFDVVRGSQNSPWRRSASGVFTSIGHSRMWGSTLTTWTTSIPAISLFTSPHFVLPLPQCPHLQLPAAAVTDGAALPIGHRACARPTSWTGPHRSARHGLHANCATSPPVPAGLRLILIPGQYYQCTKEAFEAIQYFCCKYMPQHGTL